MIALHVYRLLQAVNERVEGDARFEQHTGQLKKYVISTSFSASQF